MPFQLIRADLTTMDCDAVVNPTNTELIGTGGVDGQIHRAAGVKLDEACEKIGFCAPGGAVLTRGYDLPAKHIIHTVGPVWIDGTHGEAETLAACYRSALAIAEKKRFKTVAFPIISAGTFGFPKDQALQIAVREISDHVLRYDRTVYLVVYNRELFQISKKLFRDVGEYIDEHYVQEHSFPSNARRRESYSAPQAGMSMPLPSAPSSVPRPEREPADASFSMAFGKVEPDMELDESFQQMLLRKIDESGMTDPQCYKKANIDKKLFSKIRKDIHYKPRKATAIAFAIALELDLEETEELLRKAGYALSHSSRFDVIIEYFIVNRKYNIFEINEVLYRYDQTLLGA